MKNIVLSPEELAGYVNMFHAAKELKETFDINPNIEDKEWSPKLEEQMKKLLRDQIVKYAKNIVYSYDRYWAMEDNLDQPLCEAMAEVE